MQLLLEWAEHLVGVFLEHEARNSGQEEYFVNAQRSTNYYFDPEFQISPG
jgi:hypothetical protein